MYAIDPGPERPRRPRNAQECPERPSRISPSTRKNKRMSQSKKKQMSVVFPKLHLDAKRLNFACIRLFLNVFDENSAIFCEIDTWRHFVISVSKPRNFDLLVVQSEELLSWRSLRRFVRMRCLCVCSVFVHWSQPRSCHLSVPRALCMCVHARGGVSYELCVCGIFCVRWIEVFASVESLSWQCFVLACVCF